jgi:hypothetical protein
LQRTSRFLHLISGHCYEHNFFHLLIGENVRVFFTNEILVSPLYNSGERRQNIWQKFSETKTMTKAMAKAKKLVQILKSVSSLDELKTTR